MALNFVFVPNASSTGLIPLDQIDDETKRDVEEVYESLRKADGRMRVQFPTEQEANEWAKKAASYCTQRPEGALRFRRSPTKGLPKNMIDFRITADLPANGEKRANEDKQAGR